MKIVQNKIFLLLVAIISAPIVESYRILGVFPFNAKSHNVMFNSLMKSLVSRGHQVDHITYYSLKNLPKNYNVIFDLNGTLPPMLNKYTFDMFRSFTVRPEQFVVNSFGNKLCELLKLPEFQKIVKNPPKDPPYDVVITEAFGAHCFMGLGQVFNVPVVALSSTMEYPWIANFMGNDDNLAYTSNLLLKTFDKFNFWDRLYNFLSYHTSVYHFNLGTDKAQTDCMRKYLKADMPNIREIEKNVSLILVNKHPIICGSKPTNPNVIEVSGLHIDEKGQKLSVHLQKWLDESTNGAILITFGSLMLFDTLPKDLLIALYKSFSKIAPVRVLLKADLNKLPPGLPKNVLTSTWFPQQAVLAHKNIRAFVTHGGIMGTQEALYFGVPMIGIPIFADQPHNVNSFVAKNMAIRIEIDNMTTAALDEAFAKILTQPIYRENAKYYSKLFKDRPLSAHDTAIFWIEYVIRNGGSILKSPALDLSWWQLALLDVYGFLLFVIISSLTVIYYLLRLLFKICFSKSSKKLKSK